MARDSSVGIATRYGLDGPGVESRCGARFSEPVQTGPGAHPVSYKVGTGSFPGVSVGAWRWPPTPSSSELKEGVWLYLYFPSGPSWPILLWTLHYFTLTLHKGDNKDNNIVDHVVAQHDKFSVSDDQPQSYGSRIRTVFPNVL